MSNTMIREWARENGLQVGDRGMIPRPIIEAYKAANGVETSYDHIEPAPIPIRPAPEPEPITVTTTEPPVVDGGPRLLSVAEWLEMRDELAGVIVSAMSPKDAAERILLDGWTPANQPNRSEGGDS